MEKKRILIVDDEIGPRESLRILLRDDFDIAVTSSAAECLARLEESVPDLVILDLKMSGMDGLELLGHIRARHRELKVFMLTGYSTPEVERQARKLGVSAYLSKPFDIFELRKMVAGELNGKSRPKSGPEADADRAKETFYP